MMFSTNQIIESVLCEAPFEQPARVLWMNRDRDMATLFTVSEPLKKPWRARISEIESMLKAGKLRVMSMRPAVFMLQSEDELSEAAKAKRSECCSGQPIPDTMLSFSSTTAGASPWLN